MIAVRILYALAIVNLGVLVSDVLYNVVSSLWTTVR
jgi:hypothetical protein